MESEGAAVEDADPNLKPEPHAAEARALALLAELRQEQQDLPRGAALAWERAAFREAFLEAGPAQRIRAFLEGRRQGT